MQNIDDFEKRPVSEADQEAYIDIVNEENKKHPFLNWIFLGIIVTLFLLAWLVFANTDTQNFRDEFWLTIHTFFNQKLLVYMCVGFAAQMVDGALGMAYGATATAFLSSIGVGSAQSSASIHIAEVFTTGASGISHFKLGNVNKKLFKSLVIPGIVGAASGAFLLCLLEKGGLFSEEDIKTYLKPIMTIYTLILGCIVLKKALKKNNVKKKIKNITSLALFGSFMDSIGGGGWGPIVTSTLLSRGRSVSYTIGSVNSAEFFVAFSSSLVFFLMIGLDPGLWQVVLGLIIGGVLASPFAAFAVAKIKRKPLMIFVGCFIIFLSLNTLLKLSIGYDMIGKFIQFCIGGI
ncbi:MAG: sulfite exporter TauE/SafE family protein [Pseudarcicella sp.]|nr:sulfite exporter TauE/SafE family protein [Pseudarcicella sp.]MBP6410247.1 sulfite exporter TauE/SafE family protein [Pseudarcicella sp.]